MSNTLKLTKAQEKKAEEYRERYLKITLSTEPCDRAKAEEAIRESYKIINKKRKENNEDLLSENPKFIWVDSPHAGAHLSARMLNPTVTDETSSEFKELVRSQGNLASYGSFEGYWISFYDFISSEIEFKNKEMVACLRSIAENCGLFWTFDQTVIISEKPIKISLNKDNKLHDTEDLAIKYKDGTGVCAVNGVRKKSLVECALSDLYDGISDKMAGE